LPAEGLFAQGMLDALSSHIALLDATGTLLAVNKAWHDFAEANPPYDMTQVGVGANYLRVCEQAQGAGSEEAAAFAGGIRAVLSGERESFEMEYPCHAPDEKRWFMGRVTRFPGAGPARVVVAHEDITARRLAKERLHQALTERKRVQKTLWESEEGFRLMQENVRDYAIFLEDLAGTIINWNVGAEHIFGYSADEILGEPGSALFTPEDRKRGIPEKEIHKAATEGRAEDERWHIRRDGSRFWASGIMTALRDEEGRLRGFAKIARDMTERKRIEQELARNTAHIQALNERLRSAMTETHHRVKNNLQIIAAMIDMQLLEATPAVATEELKRLSGHVSALAAVHDLLTEQAKGDGIAEYVHAAAVLEKLLPLLEALAARCRLHFRLEADVRLPARQATSLALVANELALNALKHCRSEVEVTFSVQESFAVLEVRDDGPGFPAEFDPHQAAHTGLEMVQNLSRIDLEGQTRYENRPEGGARVTVTLPLPV